MGSLRTVSVIACFALAGGAGVAGARSVVSLDVHSMHHRGAGVPFAMQDTPLGGSQTPVGPGRTAAAGSTVAVFEGDVVVIDSDSGNLVRTDAEGRKLAELHIGSSAGQLVVDGDRGIAYVADRAGDRIVVVDLGDGLRSVTSFSTRAEPFGLAASADGGLLLVTHVADQSLTAYEAGTGHEKWNLPLGPEPRGVALANDGSEALVTFLTTGVVGRVDLLAHGTPSVEWVSIDPPVRAESRHFGAGLVQKRAPQEALLVRNPDEGRGFARNAFAAAYVGHGVAVVPHQVSTPHLPTAGDFAPAASGYGGGDGFTAPISHRLAFLQMPDGGESRSVRTAFAATDLHQPRALAYDAKADTLYLAGHGSDDVIALAEVSQTSVHLAWSMSVGTNEACGPSGLAVDETDGSVVAYCSLTRSTVRVARASTEDRVARVVHRSPELAQSRLSPAAQRGQAMFRDGTNPRLSQHGIMACASCHAEGRSDGLSWFLEGHQLQTPLLAGRLVGAHPFKWDGKDPTLKASLTNTVLRLGGSGITTREAKDLEAFLTSVDPPRAPSVGDPAAVARGKALFESDRTACAKCHYGPLLTDGKRHKMAADLGEVDTPSLIGLAHSAPYYHDGSASSLHALMRGNGSIHGMGRISRLDDDEIDDLVAYLETL
jgi:DNA-binding beta-propeller fold protein YncE/mono/diheme cytochrome c family protein